MMSNVFVRPIVGWNFMFTRQCLVVARSNSKLSIKACKRFIFLGTFFLECLNRRTLNNGNSDEKQ